MKNVLTFFFYLQNQGFIQLSLEHYFEFKNESVLVRYFFQISQVNRYVTSVLVLSCVFHARVDKIKRRGVNEFQINVD
jgi:hypothetical protein